MAGIEAGGQADPLFLVAEFNGGGVFAGILFAAVAELAKRDRRGKDSAPIDFRDEGADFIRAVASGVEATDEATHAGAGDVINGDAVVFEPLEDADVGEAEGAATGKSDTDFEAAGGRFWPILRCGLLWGLSRREGGEEEKRAERSHDNSSSLSHDATFFLWH